MSLTAVSLFAGVGGFDLALRAAGAEVVAMVEWDKKAQGVLRHRFPDTALFGDVQEVSGDELRAAGFIPERGIVVGGFPCQDLSVAGKRAGLAGQRSGMFWEIVRLLEDLQPRWVCLENVPGLLSSQGGRDMGTVLGALADLGYGVAYRVLDAQFFGVPQRRRRVFIVGCLGDDGRAPAQVLALGEGLRGHLEASQSTRQEAAGTLGGGVGSRGWAVGALTKNMAGGGGGADDNTAQAGHLVAATLTAHHARSGTDVDHVENLVPAVTSKWAKQTGGPAGDEHQNLVLVGEVPPSSEQRGLRDMEAGGVVPTLNDFDNGTEVRATVVVAQLFEPKSAMDENWAERDVKNALRAEASRSSHAITVGGEISHALTGEGHDASEDGTGRGTPIIAFGHTQGLDPQASEVATPTLRKGGDGAAVAIDANPDRPFLAENRHDEGIRLHPDTAPTVRTAYGTGGGNVPMTVQAFDELNMRTTEKHQTLRAGTPQSTGVLAVDTYNGTVTGDITHSLRAEEQGVPRAMEAMQVRRLTPMECERLQGFPDGWTSHRVDPKKGVVEQADSPRYRQMGNAVAVPCVEWIMRRLVAVDEEMR